MSRTESSVKSRFHIRVQPGAAKNGLAGKTGGVWKVKVTAPPVEGRANESCIRLLAELLGVRSSAIAIVGGKSGRQKTIEVRGLTAEEIEQRLEAASRGH